MDKVMIEKVRTLLRAGWVEHTGMYADVEACCALINLGIAQLGITEGVLVLKSETKARQYVRSSRVLDSITREEEDA